jgi:hypothetical protein
MEIEFRTRAEIAADEAGLTTTAADEYKGDGKIYNLQGIRVDNPTQGIYIQNGKKFVVK